MASHGWNVDDKNGFSPQLSGQQTLKNTHGGITPYEDIVNTENIQTMPSPDSLAKKVSSLSPKSKTKIRSTHKLTETES